MLKFMKGTGLEGKITVWLRYIPESVCGYLLKMTSDRELGGTAVELIVPLHFEGFVSCKATGDMNVPEGILYAQIRARSKQNQDESNKFNRRREIMQGFKRAE